MVIGRNEITKKSPSRYHTPLRKGTTGIFVIRFKNIEEIIHWCRSGPIASQHNIGIQFNISLDEINAVEKSAGKLFSYFVGENKGKSIILFNIGQNESQALRFQQKRGGNTMFRRVCIMKLRNPDPCSRMIVAWPSSSLKDILPLFAKGWSGLATRMTSSRANGIAFSDDPYSVLATMTRSCLHDRTAFKRSAEFPSDNLT